MSVCINTFASSASWVAPVDAVTPQCVVSAIHKESCLDFETANPGYTTLWWDGAYYLPAQYNNINPGPTNPPCTSFCRHADTSTRETCIVGTHCSNPYCKDSNQKLCTDPAMCENSGYCDVLEGCYYPLLVTDKTCNFALMESLFAAYSSNLGGLLDQNIRDFIVWTPEGCLFVGLNGFLVNSVTCSKTGGYYRSHADWKALTELTCTKQKNLCKLRTPNPLDSAYTSKDIWGGYSGVTVPSECAACDGEIVSAYKWIKGKMVPNSKASWMELSISSRAMTKLYNTAQTLPKDKYLQLLEKLT